MGSFYEKKREREEDREGEGEISMHLAGVYGHRRLGNNGAVSPSALHGTLIGKDIIFHLI
jgi:hypothetical protein